MMLSEKLCAPIGTSHSEAVRFLPFFVFAHIPLNRVNSQCYVVKKEAHEKNMNITYHF